MAGNRFLELPHRPSVNRLHQPLSDRHRSWARPTSATSRELVVLLENNGLDVDFRGLVDAVVDTVPGASAVIGADLRARVAAELRQWFKKVTDTALEEAELTLNRYGAAAPDTYGSVHILRNSTATLGELRSALFGATRAGHVVDLLILTHGSAEYIAADSGIGPAEIRRMRTDFGGPLNLRSVNMMSCVGGSLNPAWLDAGARTSAGTTGNNYLPEPTMHFFWKAWKGGQTFESAVLGAYRSTIDTINQALRAIVTAISPVAGALLADSIDVSGLDFVASSRPVVAGNGTLTISTDTLPAPVTSTTHSLVTTVVPARAATHVARWAAAASLTAPLTLSPVGRALVEQWERPLVAPGPAGDAEITARIAAAEQVIRERVEPVAPQPLAQHQYDALVCFGCGIGATAFASSGVVRLLTQGRAAMVPDEIRRWTRVRRAGRVVESRALQRRREAEARCFAGDDHAVPASLEVSEWSRQQSPAILGIAVADAIQIGLGAVAVGQTAWAASSGALNLKYDKQERLMTDEARAKMPGSRQRKTHRRHLFWFPSMAPGHAQALFEIVWDGNDYGELGTPVIQPVPEHTSDWVSASLTMEVSAVKRIPTQADPREWPLCYHYEGKFDPVGNGEWDIQGDFEINAFGGIRFMNHKATSRSLADWAIDADTSKWKGDDVVVPVPPMPADQAAYLRANAK